MIFLSKTQLKWLNEDKVFFSFRFYMLSIAYEWLYIDVWLDIMLFTKNLLIESVTGYLVFILTQIFCWTTVANKIYHFFELKRQFQNCLRLE